MRRISLLLTLPVLANGCVILGTPNLEGSWLFMVDRNSSASGSCVDPDNTSTAVTTFVGPDESIVEIYKTQDGSYVIPGGGGWLTGDWNDEKVFVADWTDTYIYEDSDNSYSERESTRQWIRATWGDGKLVGTVGVDEETETNNAGTVDAWDCQTTSSFSAVEITSSENKYVED
ncbi:MAG: hypothetical protein H6740_21125 [Alphaproteobacteria bacterium]|nr:hypothetical protein [Alphaproteobacteria bacterium]